MNIEPLVEGGDQPTLASRQKFRERGGVVTERHADCETGTKIEADHGSGHASQLARAPECHIPDLPGFECLGFVLEVGARCTGAIASGAIVWPAAKMPAAASRQTFFSESRSRAGAK